MARPRLHAFCFVASFVVGCCAVATTHGQNLRSDYLHNVPRQYSPDDPQRMGRVLRQQVGHGGLYYNCDCEEDKRFSPYIEWRQQSCQRCRNDLWSISQQQLCEIRHRVAVGKCCTDNFPVASCCRPCELYLPPAKAHYMPAVFSENNFGKHQAQQPNRTQSTAQDNGNDWLLNLYR